MIKPYYSEPGIDIYHGDCRSILPHLPKVDLVLTDPPFAEETHKGARTGSADRVLVDFASLNEEQILSIFTLLRSSCDKWVVSFLDWRHVLCLERQSISDLEMVRFGVWVKPNGMPQYSGDRPSTGWEAIAFCHRKGKKIWNGGGRSGVFIENFEQKDRSHPTQKPIKLIRTLIELFSWVDNTILDPFMGSGTTLVAAKQLGRKAIGIEIEKKCCDIAIDRLRQEVLPLNQPEAKQYEQEGLF